MVDEFSNHCRGIGFQWHSNAVSAISEKTARSEAEARESLVSFNPQQRLVRPEEVANAVLWLCLPGSESMNGQSLAIAGGEVT